MVCGESPEWRDQPPEFRVAKAAGVHWQQMELSSRWWYAFAVWPAIAFVASAADWSWRRQSFAAELSYHFFGDICVALAVAAVPFVAQRRARRPEHLSALEAELHPHFLFNTLNSIATLMHEDVDAADEMMAKLATLLRRTMDRGAVEIALKEELEILEIYLDIQRTRYEDRLTTEVTADPDTLDVLVPRLVLQPVVENAVSHGISRRTDAGRIAVRARCQDGALRLTVTNDGAGWPAKSGSGRGLGLKNTLERLKRFDRRCTFDLREGGDRGAVATITLPVRR